MTRNNGNNINDNNNKNSDLTKRTKRTTTMITTFNFFNKHTHAVLTAIFQVNPSQTVDTLLSISSQSYLAHLQFFMDIVLSTTMKTRTTITTNTIHFLTGQLFWSYSFYCSRTLYRLTPFLLPDQQYQSTEW